MRALRGIQAPYHSTLSYKIYNIMDVPIIPEGRKREEDPGYQPATEGRYKRQGEKQIFDHLANSRDTAPRSSNRSRHRRRRLPAHSR
jgi:hypothetical protein